MTDEKTILIVDDEPDITTLAEKLLKLENYNTMTCNSGKEALNIIKEMYDEISLILLDIKMPELNGFEVLKEIKTNDKFKDIIVVMFTIVDNPSPAIELEADGYILKPFAGRDLLNYVQRKLSCS